MKPQVFPNAPDLLETYSSQSDCFRRASGAVRMRCNELDIGEPERVHLAISMTLCELATAEHYSTPMECVPFILKKGAPVPRWSSQVQGACVDALSRSAQLWSSYSGYLREIPQLCFAFRRWNDIDTARDIYKNITHEKVTFLGFLLTRERSLAKVARNLDQRLDDLKGLHTLFEDTFKLLSNKSRDLHAQITSQLESAWFSFHARLLQSQKEHASQQGMAVEQAQLALNMTLSQHAKDLRLTLHPIKIVIDEEMRALFSHLAKEHLTLSKLSDQIMSSWRQHGSELDVLMDKQKELLAASSEIFRTLNRSLIDARSVEASHIHTTLMVQNISNGLIDLVNNVHSEFTKINQTAVAVREGIRKDKISDQWFYAALTRIVALVFGVDLVTMEPGDAYFTRLLLAVIKTSANVLQVGISGLLSILVFFLSCRKYFTPAVQSQERNEKSKEYSLQNWPACSSSLSTHNVSLSQRTTLANSSYRKDPRFRVSRIPDRLCKTG